MAEEPGQSAEKEAAAEAARKAAAARRQAAGKADGADEGVSRRDFLRLGLYGTAVLFLAQIAGTFFTFFWPRKVGAFGGEINIGSYREFPPGSVTKIEAGKFYLVHMPDAGLLAIYWRCTHLGCTVPWQPDAHPQLTPPGCFCCNCHGSQFSFTGDYLAGPAPRPLDLFEVRIDDAGDVIVNTGKVIERADYNPSQATPVPA